MKLDRDDVQKRFRRLLRTAHPDHGGASAGAAERIAELTEARELLLAEHREDRAEAVRTTRTRRSASRARRDQQNECTWQAPISGTRLKIHDR